MESWPGFCLDLQQLHPLQQGRACSHPQVWCRGALQTGGWRGRGAASGHRRDPQIRRDSWNRNVNSQRWALVTVQSGQLWEHGGGHQWCHHGWQSRLVGLTQRLVMGACFERWKNVGKEILYFRVCMCVSFLLAIISCVLDMMLYWLTGCINTFIMEVVWTSVPFMFGHIACNHWHVVYPFLRSQCHSYAFTLKGWENWELFLWLSSSLGWLLQRARSGRTSFQNTCATR